MKAFVDGKLNPKQRSLSYKNANLWWEENTVLKPGYQTSLSIKEDPGGKLMLYSLSIKEDPREKQNCQTKFK